MMRTFIMFQNVSTFSNKLDFKFRENPEWQELNNLFRTIESSDRSEDVEKFTDMYLRAQKIQLARSGNVNTWDRNFPTSDIFCEKILSLLTVKQIMVILFSLISLYT